MAHRRGFAEVERRVAANKTVTFRARYAMPDGSRFSRTLATRMDAEAWLTAEKSLIDRDRLTPPPQRKIAEDRRKREASSNTLRTFTERYLGERGLRPTTVHSYKGLLSTRINPYSGEMPLRNVTLSEVKAWRAPLNPKTEATNAAAYRLLRSLLQAAEEEELIDRAPPKIRGAGSPPGKRVAVPATLDEIAIITDAMPEHLRLLLVLAAFVGLREGELFELRRSDVDGDTGRRSVSRKVDNDFIAGARGACPKCGRVISAPTTASGVRTVRVPPPFLPMLQKHLLMHARAGPTGLLFPGDRTDHMSVRYPMDRYRPARAAAGRPDLTVHLLRHTALTFARQHDATAAELQAGAGPRRPAQATRPRPRWQSISTPPLTGLSGWPTPSATATRAGPARTTSCDHWASVDEPPGCTFRSELPCARISHRIDA